jgi:hypothetical protein
MWNTCASMHNPTGGKGDDAGVMRWLTSVVIAIIGIAVSAAGVNADR